MGCKQRSNTGWRDRAQRAGGERRAPESRPTQACTAGSWAGRDKEAGSRRMDAPAHLQSRTAAANCQGRKEQEKQRRPQQACRKMPGGAAARPAPAQGLETAARQAGGNHSRGGWQGSKPEGAHHAVREESGERKQGQHKHAGHALQREPGKARPPLALGATRCPQGQARLGTRERRGGPPIPSGPAVGGGGPTARLPHPSCAAAPHLPALARQHSTAAARHRREQREGSTGGGGGMGIKGHHGQQG